MEPPFYYKGFHKIPLLKDSFVSRPRMLRGTSPLARDSLDKQKLTIFADLESGGCFKVPFNAVRKNSLQIDSFEKVPAIPPSRSKTRRSSMTYVGLIASAILRSPEQKLTLSQIYQDIEKSSPEFTLSRVGWKNTVRHNLSLHDCFVKGEISLNGKSCYWHIHPAYITRFSKGDFRKRASKELCSIEDQSSASQTNYCRVQSAIPCQEFGKKHLEFSFMAPAPSNSALPPYVRSAVHCPPEWLRDYKAYPYHFLFSPAYNATGFSSYPERRYGLGSPPSHSQ